MQPPDKEHTGITVLESRWWEESNTSVRGLFDLISDIHHGDHHSYNYEMVNSRAAFEEALSRYSLDEATNYLSINCHGKKSALGLYNGDRVTGLMIREILKRDTDVRCLSGVHFGSCLFGTDEMATYLYEEDISPWWIAGYRSSPYFIPSTALDFLFFNELLEKDPDEPVKSIQSVARTMKKQVGGLISKLKFGIYLLDDKRGRVTDLLEQ